MKKRQRITGNVASAGSEAQTVPVVEPEHVRAPRLAGHPAERRCDRRRKRTRYGVCVSALQACPQSRERNVGTIPVSGGAGTAIADSCHEAGLETGAINAEKVERKRPCLPTFASLQNPAEVTGSAGNHSESFATILAVLAENPVIDTPNVALTAVCGNAAEIVARESVNIRHCSPKPVVISWNYASAQSNAAYNLLKEAGVPIYAVACGAVFAIEALSIFAGVAPVRANAASGISSIS